MPVCTSPLCAPTRIAMVQNGAQSMAGADDEFRPKLGRIRSSGGRAAKRYIGKLYAKMEQARPGAFARRSGSKFTGARIGRGAGLGAAFAQKGHPFAKFRSRRVTVKTRSVRLGKNGLPKARAHLRYLQRDGAEKDGTPGKLYGRTRDVVDGDAFLGEGRTERHQFRIIVSPEEAGELENLDSFTRDVMTAAERDLGTKLDWVAVNHYDTDHPHVHIVLRGRADDGKDLVIARKYITHGFRRRAEELATLELGPRRDLEIARSRMRETSAERFTSIDRELTKMAADGAVTFSQPKTVYDRFRMKLFMARLKTLETMEMAARNRNGWRLSPALETTLKETGRRGDIIRSMDRIVGERLDIANVQDFSSAGAPRKSIGRVLGSGAADDAHEKRFLGVDGADGKQWHVEIDLRPGTMPPECAIIELSRNAAAPRKSDRTIAAIADRNSGVYSDELHAAGDPKASAEYRLTHKRRLEALRRAGVVEREQDGAWRIPANYLERAAAFEANKVGAKSRVLSWVSLDRLPEAPAQTFLDDALEGKNDFKLAGAGFGEDLAKSIAARRRWLLANGLASEDGEKLNIDRNRLRDMERKSIAAKGATLAGKLGKSFHEPVEGEPLSGKYRGPLDLAAGRFAIIEKSKEFALVPWREALEARRGMEISGVMRRGGVTWNFGKNRGGPGR